MSYKISGTEVINDSRKGLFTSANVGSYTPSNRPTVGICAGDIIFNSDTKELEVYDGSKWLGGGGFGQGKSPHARGGNVIHTPTGWTHILYTSGPIRYKGSSTGLMIFKSQIIGGGGGGGSDTGAGGGGAGQYAIWTAEIPSFNGTGASALVNGYITIGAGGAGGTPIGGQGSDGSFTSDYHQYRAGAGGGGGGGSPATLAGRPGTGQSGFSISGSGGGGSAWEVGSSASGVPGGGSPNPGSNPQRQEFQHDGGQGYYQWWTTPSFGAYYTGGGGGGAGGTGPEPNTGTNPSNTYPGGAGKSIQFGYAHSSWVAWGGGGGCNDNSGNSPGNNTPSYGGPGAPDNHSRGGVEALRLGPDAGRLVMNGMYGTGSGGGGAGQSPATGGHGGSGIYILSYPIDYKNYADAMNPGMY